jgi:SAM-dependent methyltransferase
MVRRMMRRAVALVFALISHGDDPETHKQRGPHAPLASTTAPASTTGAPSLYRFYWREPAQSLRRQRETLALSRTILYPTRHDPSYIVLEARRELLIRWIGELRAGRLRVLDVGGRIQPYRPLLADRLERYVGLDPILEGQVDVVGVGQEIPFGDCVFDLVICTQALNYAPDPFRVIGEIRRVLRPGGTLFLSVPALFPRYHDQMWRFMPAGLRELLAPFERVEIIAEDRSIAGLARSINLFVDTFATRERPRRLAAGVLYPAVNWIGAHLDRFSATHTEFATNYCCRAIKGRDAAPRAG